MNIDKSMRSVVCDIYTKRENGSIIKKSGMILGDYYEYNKITRTLEIFDNPGILKAIINDCILDYRDNSHVPTMDLLEVRI